MNPKGWEEKSISELFERVNNPVEVNKNSYYKEIGIRSHGKGIFHKTPVLGTELGNKRVFHIESGCFVVNIVFAWEQAIAKTTVNENGMIASHRFPMYKPKDGECDVDFILYFFKTKRGKYFLELASPGGAGRNKTLGQTEFSKLKLRIPPLPEQKKIAKILSTWDKAISTTEQLLANSQQQKKALMQQLLTGKKRFPGFSGKWLVTPLRECANCLDNKRVPLNSSQRSNMSGKIPYWGANGIVDYINDYIFDETIVLLAEDGGYFEEYSTRPIANISYGKCWVNNHAHIITAKNICLNEWLFYSLVHKNILAYVNTGTRSKLNKNDMLNIPIHLPPIDEQNKIITILSNAYDEIETLKSKLNLLKQEKKALMQQLLTGKRRVKVDEEEESSC